MSGDVEHPAETSARRRRIVTLVDRIETPATVDQLVDGLDDGAAGWTAGPTPSQSWEALHERLTDEDLPALDRAGLLTFDADRGIVMQSGSDGRVDVGDAPDSGAVFRSDDDATGERRTTPYFLGLAVLSLGLLALTGFDVGPFAGVSDALVATGLVVSFSLLSFAAALR